MSAAEAVYFLGIDGGATKTALCLADENGKTVRRLTIGSTNPFDIGIEKSKELLYGSITEIARGIPFSSVYLFAGLSGGSSGTAQEELRALFASFGFAAFLNGSDNENLIAAGLHNCDGITVILGTGICVFSVVGGHTHRIGGWGYLIDDGGSGYNLGRDAVHAYFSVLDGSGERTILTKMIEEKAGCRGQELLSLLYDKGKREIASYAPLVLTAAGQGDEVAKAITERNVSCAAQLILTGVRDFSACADIPVVCAGGLTENEFYLDLLRKQFSADRRIHVSVLSCEPVSGAVQKAIALKTEVCR